jgi:hypothetical protein
MAYSKSSGDLLASLTSVGLDEPYMLHNDRILLSSLLTIHLGRR